MTYLKNKEIYISGGNGFLGSHLVDRLVHEGISRELISTPRSNQFDLRRFDHAVEAVREKKIIFHLAGNVGGIGYNQEHPGTLFYDNLMMGVNLIEACRRNGGIEKLILVGTICSYPKFTELPFKEENLWHGFPEETNAPYGIAKKSLLMMAQAYQKEFGLNSIYLLPVNLYGPRDHFDPRVSHVIPALIKKFVDARQQQAREVTAWGTGRATREFLYVEDAAEGITLAAQDLDILTPVNLGSGMEISIKELTELIAGLVGYDGEIFWDTTKPDGQPRRRLDTSKAKELFDFEARTDFKTGLRQTIDWYREQQDR
ncbi:MAG: GDP-L-fucose synthase [Microgenomates group bacterium]